VIALHSSFKIDKLLKVAKNSSLCFSAGVFVFFALFLLFSLKEEKPLIEPCYTSAKNERLNSPYEAIGTGPLSLNEGQLSRFLNAMRKEILILAKNTRPDAVAGKPNLLIGLKNAGVEKAILEGSTVYLDVKQSSSNAPLVYSFSEKRTPLWIKPVGKDSSSVMIEVGGDRQEERGKFLARSLPQENLEGRLDLSSFKALQEAELCGKDKFLEIYGGEEYKDNMSKHKLLLKDEKCFYVCYVSLGDYLVWEEGRWKVTSLKLAAQGASLSYVKSATPDAVEMLSWDEEGFYPLELTLVRKQASKPSSKMEEVITSMRLRTSSQVSCMVGKKRMLIKPGDWLLKTSFGWHKLRRLSEIEDYLSHKLMGELFVVDSLEKEQGKMVIRGLVFDERRAQPTHCSLVVSDEKKGQIKTKKKASFLQNGNNK